MGRQVEVAHQGEVSAPEGDLVGAGPQSRLGGSGKRKEYEGGEDQ
jgi:hypothetical protein